MGKCKALLMLPFPVQAAQRKQAELDKSSVAGAVVDIMIKEVGPSWASLCWKKPEVTT